MVDDVVEVEVDGKLELRKIDSVEKSPLNKDGSFVVINKHPVLFENEELLQTFDGKFLIVKKHS